MAERVLLIEAHLLDDRYHGAGDWPPSPFRLFQALVASAYGGRWAAQNHPQSDRALAWLEKLPPPVVGVPLAHAGRPTKYYVPNNDLDAVGGQMDRIGEIRSLKIMAEQIFPSGSSLLYAWRFQDGEEHLARVVIELAHRIHHFGRGVDAAFADARIVLRVADAEQLISHLEGAVYRPTGGDLAHLNLRCPGPGSLSSLKERHQRHVSRFVGPALRQAEPPRYRLCPYNRPPADLLFELRSTDASKLSAVRLQDSCLVALRIREQVVNRLKQAFPNRVPEIERVVRGRGAGDADRTRRVLFIPIPSIGFVYADRDIRRVLVRVGPDCPFNVEEVSWAAAGIDLGGKIMTPTEDNGMLRHYGFDNVTGARWRTVTAALLAAPRPRRRASGITREEWERRVLEIAQKALTHAALPTDNVSISVRREPFDRNGVLANAFVRPPYLRGRLPFHVEAIFPRPLRGPLVIGDGRFLGLGLMAPAEEDV